MHHFLDILMDLKTGAVNNQWKYERLIVLTNVYLQRKNGVVSTKDIHQCLAHHMDLWDWGEHTALSEDTM